MTITVVLLVYLLAVIMTVLPLGVQKLSGGTADMWLLSQVVETAVGLGGK